MDKGQVSRGIKRLNKEGFVVRNGYKNLVFITPDFVDQESTIAPLEVQTPGQEIVDSQSPIVDSQSPIVDQESTPSENQLLKPTLKQTKGEGEKSAKEKKSSSPPPTFPSTSWQYVYGKATVDALIDLGVAPLSHVENKPKAYQDAARHFNRLHSGRGKFSEEEIAPVMKWLLRADNWWIVQGNFCSTSKLNDTDKQGRKYFQVFQTKMKADESRTSKTTYSPGAEFERLNKIAEDALASG